jgi:hypothetical protein
MQAVAFFVIALTPSLLLIFAHGNYDYRTKPIMLTGTWVMLGGF